MESKQDLKAQASRLRQQGMTYPQIVSALDGAVSVDWCKRNLKGLSKGHTEKEHSDELMLKELIQLATRKEGVSVYEANGVIMKHSKARLTSVQISNIRAKAKRRNPECLFRPDWVSLEHPSDSYQSLCAYVLHLQDEVDNIVRWYCDTYPEVSPHSVKWELLEHLKPSTKGESLAARIKRSEKLVELLMTRLTGDTPITTPP